ncbi:sensor histidine kinase [Spirosoma fluminis]
MQNFIGGIEIVILATAFLFLISVTPILFVFLHRRQYQRYLSEKEQLRSVYQQELLQSQLETQNQTLQQIGQELHDHIGQLLTVAVMRLNNLEDEVTDPDTQGSVQQTRDLVSTIITDVRTLAKTLDHDTVRHFGLRDSLAFELERIRHVGRQQTAFQVTGEPYSLGADSDVIVFRMIQEALNNALKHAKAQALTVSLDYQKAMVFVSVVDDGVGFMINESADRSIDQIGSGLRNLHRRATLLGGECLIQSKPGDGTSLEIKLPRNHAV